jgi:hypothetical protein
MQSFERTSRIAVGDVDCVNATSKFFPLKSNRHASFHRPTNCVMDLSSFDLICGRCPFCNTTGGVRDRKCLKTSAPAATPRGGCRGQKSASGLLAARLQFIVGNVVAHSAIVTRLVDALPTGGRPTRSLHLESRCGTNRSTGADSSES